MAPPRRPEIVIGLDVGKSSHWACAATRDGEVLASKPVANRENALDSLFAEFPGALAVVDQVRSIGALALSRARETGMRAVRLDTFEGNAPARALYAGLGFRLAGRADVLHEGVIPETLVLFEKEV